MQQGLDEFANLYDNVKTLQGEKMLRKKLVVRLAEGVHKHTDGDIGWAWVLRLTESMQGLSIHCSTTSEREAMRGLIRLVVLMVLVVAASGCGIVRQVESHGAHDKLLQLQVGMERELVLSLMGKPYTREAYGDMELLFYETNHWANDERKRFTPILIKDGKVAGWGRKYYSDSGEQKGKAGVGAKPR